MNLKKKMKWEVYGEYGDKFTNLEDAKMCAKLASKTPEHDYKASVWNIEEYMSYIEYENGKCVRDGWTLCTTKTGKKAKFNIGGKIVERSIYLTPDGSKVIKYNNEYHKVNI